jgi:D-alanyl-D-alanine carboxypeptidase/D-alanyl-D-alanine-endopeptidase (penicillin-binding protein 4)
MVVSPGPAKLALTILLLLGGCAGDGAPPETTPAPTSAASAPPTIPEAKPDSPGQSTELSGLLEDVKSVAQELPARPRPTEIAVPDGRAAAAKIAARPAGTEVGYLMVDLETGYVMAELNPDLPLIPASTAKLATAVVALDVLGPDYVYLTELLADGDLEDGVLRGDLILRGGGDPALDVADLLELAVQLENLGIYRVDGRFLIDDTVFPVLSEIDPRQPAEAAYNPGIGALSVAFNRVRVAWRGGSARNAITLPPLEEARFESVSPAELSRSGFDLEDMGDEAVVWRVADRGGRRQRASLPVKDPGLHAGRVFRQLALAQGIALEQPQRVAAPVGAEVLAVHRSMALRYLVRDMLVYSNNMMAEMIGLSTAARLSNDVASLQAAGALMVRHLSQLMPEIDWSTAALGNHSGLDGAARLTPRQLAAIAQYGWRSDTLPALLPGGGWSGTLSDRFSGPDEALRVWAKTGTLNYGSSLAGFLFPASGRPAVFATMVSDVGARTSYDATPRPRRVGESSAGRWLARARALQDGLIQSWLKPLPTS